MHNGKQRVIVIVGATGSGKSDLGIRLAREIGGEVICADSRTVYRGMDIGTAKPCHESSPPPCSAAASQGRPPAPPPGGRGREDGKYPVCGIPHHLVDIRHPDEPYSVAEFKVDAERCIREIIARGRVPIVVGGTMLYVRALVDNLDFAQASANPVRRAELERMPLHELQALLLARDPAAAEMVDLSNARRVVRAIETIEATGKSLADVRGKGESLYAYTQIGIAPPRDVLAERIAQRTLAMFDAGLLAEVERLVARYGSTIEPLRGVVYRECIAWLVLPAGERAPREELEAQITRALLWYARRQLAWFRKDARMHWVEHPDAALTLIT